MVHNKKFQKKDEVLTEEFLEDFVDEFTGERVLDICGGIGRYGKLLKYLFKKVDVLDLKPSLGDIPLEK